MKYGCIGEKLGHSFSKEIHGKIADYPYCIREIPPGELASFMEKKGFIGINVTIPYKQAVIPFLDKIDFGAKEIGAVNTIVNRNGKLFGYNTDFFGMKALMEKNSISCQGKKVLVLGTGGTSKTARCVAKSMGAKSVLTVGRTKKEGCITYEEMYREHSDANVIIQTTPVGMFPAADGCPLDFAPFWNLTGVVDAVYHPLKTNLVLEAEKRGITAVGGLYMLVAQAVFASEYFLDVVHGNAVIEKVYTKMLKEKENIVLIGMPGCGKTTIGTLLAEDGKSFFDSDKEIEKEIGCTIKSYMESHGEEAFRDVEERVIARLSNLTGCVISVGGGAVLRENNRKRLKRNGRTVFLNTPLERLVPTDDRPLSDTIEKLKALYAARIDIYRAIADIEIIPPAGISDTLAAVKEALQ